MTVEQLSERFSAVRALARRLMDENGLTSWAFRFNKNLVRSGVCRRKLGRGSIELSAYYVQLNPLTVIVDTIKHEVAHAIVGPEHGHSEAWRAKCRELGCKPEVTYGMDVKMPAGKYQAVCPSCNTRFHRHRKPRVDGCYHHEDCGPRKGRLVWERVEPSFSK
ncbi:MAG TPA: SprT-like domain-containing protein [Urbifossiella sp.]|nr:SprT-like domain-containing protein [Urbifossiella sp.]